MKNKLKKIYVVLIVFTLIILNISPTFASTSEPNLSAESAILIDNRTNKILYEKDSNKKMYPASTTKILTAILTLENCNLDEVITASYDAVMSIPDGYSSADIQIGEELTIEQLLQVLLIYSANDAANVLAEHVGGSVDSFVSMMNTKLDELGIKNTHFTNAYGKHDDDHYTTSYDLAMIMQYCLKNETFRKIAGSVSCAIPATNKHSERLYTSTNEILNPNSYNYLSYLTTGKTGYTSQAKECLVSSAYKNDLELICVVLGAGDNGSNRFTDTKALYDYGYSNYMIKNIVDENSIGTKIEVKNATKDTKQLDLLIKENISALVKISEQDSEVTPEIILNDKISAPIEENQTLGKIKYTVNGVEYTTDLIASHSVEKSNLLTYVISIIFIIVILFLIYKIFFSNKKNKYESNYLYYRN
jgi:D-alanyl-D-alanine carboxypeptidase (penicillin-binding protein 5/6)